MRNGKIRLTIENKKTQMKKLKKKNYKFVHNMW
jgi:hypothetical protein